MTDPRYNASTGRTLTFPELTEREELVLRSIVQHYVLTANPVGSRVLSKRLEETLSAATLRNVMADLEEKGFISHPHTSAGRVPTDQGYRLYVDMLMRMEEPSRDEQKEIVRQIDRVGPEAHLLKETSRLVAAITNQLGIVTAPHILDAILDRIELVPLASARLMVVLSLRARIVRTVTLEIAEQIDRDRIELAAALLNERLVGLTLGEIRASCRDRLSDLAGVDGTEQGLVRLFIDSADKIFTEEQGSGRVHVVPSRDILHQPEFSTPDSMRGIVELMQNEEIVIHLLEGNRPLGDIIQVTIGSEHGDERMVDYSMIATRYRVGETYGTIGLIGPKRMPYARLMSLVGYVANTLSNQMREKG